MIILGLWVLIIITACLLIAEYKSNLLSRCFGSKLRADVINDHEGNGVLESSRKFNKIENHKFDLSINSEENLNNA